MATVANSQPAFAQRLEELGIAHLLPEFKKKGWHTFGNFGYAISSPEVSKNKTEFEAEILKPLLGSDLLLAPQVRRLFTQSYIIATAELEQYGSAKSREPIELHPAERDSRRDALEKKLTGFDVRGLHEPSHALLSIALLLCFRRTRFAMCPGKSARPEKAKSSTSMRTRRYASTRMARWLKENQSMNLCVI